MKLKDLKFNYMQFDPNTGELTQHNLFDSSRVKYSVARWKTMSPKVKRQIKSDVLHYCFFDTCGRCEYEFLIEPWSFAKEAKQQKVDIWTMYVEPNADLLVGMVDSVSIASCREYIKEWNTTHKKRKV